jgi:hypothetical protein
MVIKHAIETNNLAVAQKFCCGTECMLLKKTKKSLLKGRKLNLKSFM